MYRTTCVAMVTLGLLLVAPERARSAAFAISWVGTGSYSMSGTFSYDDSVTGVINIDPSNAAAFIAANSFTLTFSGDSSGSPFGTFDLADVNLTSFTFNFDTSTEQFLVGGGSGSSTGQNWITVDLGPNTFGFVSGTTNQHLTTSPTASNLFGTLGVGSSTLTATAIPEPSSLPLLGLGVATLAYRRRRESKAESRLR